MDSVLAIAELTNGSAWTIGGVCCQSEATLNRMSESSQCCKVVDGTDQVSSRATNAFAAVAMARVVMLSFILKAFVWVGGFYAATVSSELKDVPSSQWRHE